MQVVNHRRNASTPAGRNLKIAGSNMNAQLLCDGLLTLDSDILYSSYVDSSDCRIGEAMRRQIGLEEKLTILVLPVNRGKDSLILAAPIRSDLTEVVAKAKNAFSFDSAGFPALDRGPYFSEEK